MTLKRFGTGSNVSNDTLVIFENYGLTVYAAQLYERDLQVVVTGLERLGAITLPDDTRRDRDGYVESCLGPMLHALETQGTMDRDMSRLLKKAHYHRNHLVHRFMAENALDMLNPAGRAAINDRLQNLFTTITRAGDVASKLRDLVWADLGVSREQVDRQIAEWQRLSDPDAEVDPE